MGACSLYDAGADLHALLREDGTYAREVPQCLCITRDKADDDALRRSRKCLRHLFERTAMKVQCIITMEKDGIVTPNNPMRADNRREAAKGCRDLPPLRHMRLHVAPIGRDRHMPELPKVSEQFHMRDHRRRIFRTKSDKVDDGRVKAIACNLRPIKGIAHTDRSRTQTIAEPWRIECGDVRAHPCVDDHQRSPFF